VGGYSLAEVARICRVPASRVRRWERMALLRPDATRGEAEAFEFRDLVAVRRLRGLLERGVPLRQIHRGVQAARARHPELERPLAALDVWVAGAPRVVLRAAGVLAETDGQLVLDFAGSEARARVEALARGAGTAGAPQGSADHRAGEGHGEPGAGAGEGTAAEWFEVGCRLDSDAKTYAEAIDAYQRALVVDPEHADSHCNLGSIYYNQGRRGPARACFERALAADPSHVEANLNLATMLEEEERNELALRHYKRALDSDPFYADAHVSAALLYEKLGLRRMAREHWRRYLQIDPGGSWADVARRHLGAGAD
jgi:tetratricopeptide (TPR) repeat protein